MLLSEYNVKLPAWKTFKNADDWIFPAGLDAKHWNIPESIVTNPNIFKLFLKKKINQV